MDFIELSPLDSDSSLTYILPTTAVTDKDLSEDEVIRDKVYSKTHDSGWTIYAKIECDYYTWIDFFIAIHPDFGRIIGDLTCLKISYDTTDGYNNFFKNHPIDFFDREDI